MKIQEKVGKDTGSEIGSIPRSITAVLLEDLIDVCKPGDDVTVVGVVMRRWSTLGKGQEGRTGVDIDACVWGMIWVKESESSKKETVGLI